MLIKTMYHGGIVKDTKTVSRNGVPVGVISGYIATWDVDRGCYWSGLKDQFGGLGTFVESISRHKSTERQIRFKDNHGRTVGGFPIDTVREDSIGLYGDAEVNLEVEQGRDVYSLAKQGVLVDFSIGWEAETDSMSIIEGIRHISKAEIWEGSIVDEPMNPHANVTNVKHAQFAEIMGDVRVLETALKEGIRFSAKQAKCLISAMKAAGMIEDTRTTEDELVMDKMDKILTQLKKFRSA